MRPPLCLQKTILYAINVTSNDPVLSRISPIAVKILPSAITGRNIQYFRRIAAIARVINHASPAFEAAARCYHALFPSLDAISAGS
jgi:hypothetical protein